MTKKISGLLVFCMLLGFIVSASAENNAEERSKARETLIGLEIMQNLEDGQFHGEYELTRGEFARIIRNIYKGIPRSSESDIEEAIVCVKEMQLMNGYPDGNFYTELPVTYMQTVKVCMKMLGYGVLAEKSGGYPDGYMKYASRLDILGGVIVSDYEQPINRDTVALILYNTLGSQILSPEYDGENMTYNEDSSNTILSKYRKIYYGKGRVTGNIKTRITSKSGTGKGLAEIDGQTFEDPKGIVSDEFLGLYIEYYYFEENEGSGGEIVYMRKDSGKSYGYIKIESDDIEGYSGNTYAYYDKNGRRKTKTVSKSSDILYNDRFEGELQDADFMPQNGYVELFDLDNDETADFVKITEYTVCIVNVKNESDEYITDKFDYRKSIYFDERTDCYELRDINGEGIAFDDIAVGDIISFKISYDKAVISGIRGGSCDIGILSGYNTQNDITYITVGEKIYTAAKNCFYDDTLQELMGKNVNIYTDISGKAAAVESAEESSIFSYLAAMYIPEDCDNNDEVIIKLLTASGEYITETVKLPISLDGVRYEKNTELYNACLKNGEFCGEVVILDRNSLGKIRSIDTRNNANKSSSMRLKRFYSTYTDDRKPIDTNHKLYYRSALRVFGYKWNYSALEEGTPQTAVCIDDKTVIFNVPSLVGEFNSSNYQIGNYNNFDDGGTYNLEAYCTGETYGYAQCLVIYDTKESAVIAKNSDMAVVSAVSTVYDEEQGGAARKIEYYASGTAGTAVFDDLSPQTEVSAGDIISLNKNDRGYITAIEKYYDYKTDQTIGDVSGQTVSDGNYFELKRCVKGYVFSKYGSFITVADTLDGISPDTIYESIADRLDIYNVTRFRVFIYDESEKSNKVIPVNYESVQDYVSYGDECSRVVVGAKDGNGKIIVIYKK